VPADVTQEVLIDGAPLGDRFVAFRGEQECHGWLPASDVFGVALPGLLSEVGKSRGTDSAAVAAALLFEQYSLRLVAPALAGFYLDGRVVDSGLGVVRVRMVDGHIRRLAFTGDNCAYPARTEEARDGLVRGLLAGNLEGGRRDGSPAEQGQPTDIAWRDGERHRQHSAAHVLA
jgi:hypothetical protein